MSKVIHKLQTIYDIRWFTLNMQISIHFCQLLCKWQLCCEQKQLITPDDSCSSEQCGRRDIQTSFWIRPGHVLIYIRNNCCPLELDVKWSGSIQWQFNRGIPACKIDHRHVLSFSCIKQCAKVLSIVI